MSTDLESLRIGLVAHYVFCPRRAWLEEHGERTDTAQMAAGTRDHKAVDDRTTSRGDRRRAVDVSSERLGIHGRCDSVETDEDGRVTLVEHKATPRRRKSAVTPSTEVQLALQSACLEESGMDIEGAAVWFSTTRRRVEVKITQELLDRAENAVAATREVLERPKPPEPLEDDDRCSVCSHVSICLPDENRGVTPARRIGVADPLGKVLHLSTPGSRARLRKGRVVVESADEDPESVPLGQVAALSVHGNVDVSSALIRELLARGFPIIWCSWSGRVQGWASSADSPNGEARVAQHRIAERKKVDIARAMVAGKIANQRYILRRHKLGGREELRSLRERALDAETVDEALGYEGAAARKYFAEFGDALRPEWATLTKRTGRSATDAVNASLNLSYALLLADAIRALVACGLDPVGGVLHSAGRNKPSLALDLVEEFRPLIAESAVLWAINNGEIGANGFRDEFGAIYMTEESRKSLITAYERRVLSEFTHPKFDYKVTWRRAMEIQARMFLAVILGEMEEYEPIVMR